jgi:glycosyltransferase involved in cell wall biosynthesis
MTATPRLAVVCDYREELWPSMDLTGAMILAHLGSEHAGEFDAARVCPPFRHRLGRLPAVGRSGTARNVDRLLNRMVEYPRSLGRVARRNEFDLYHVVDHSYSQLVHALPPGRVVVTCHDVDTFRCLLEPDREPRPAWFRAMARRILDGLRRASAVACDSEATRDALLAHAIHPADRLHVVHLGLSPEFSPGPDPAADSEAARLLGPNGPASPPELLHVGSNIPRKRIDVLLSVFAGVVRARPGVRLIKVGGVLPADLDQQARALGISDAITVIPHIGDRALMAAVYRRAALVFLPSDAEGFGLPAIEAIATGAPLLASDLAVLREVAGDAAVYRPIGDVASWTEAALSLLDEPARAPAARQARRAAGLARAGHFSWSKHVDRLVTIYRDVLSRPIVTSSR